MKERNGGVSAANLVLLLLPSAEEPASFRDGKMEFTNSKERSKKIYIEFNLIKVLEAWAVNNFVGP